MKYYRQRYKILRQEPTTVHRQGQLVRHTEYRRSSRNSENQVGKNKVIHRELKHRKSRLDTSSRWGLTIAKILCVCLCVIHLHPISIQVTQECVGPCCFYMWVLMGVGVCACVCALRAFQPQCHCAGAFGKWSL